MVDTLKVWTKKPPFHRGSCHLTTDDLSLSELHRFAERLGMRRDWFQRHDFAPHYDLVPRRRELALALGAVHVDAVAQARKRRALGIGIRLKTWHEVALERGVEVDIG
jgi:hypothetical protein